MVTDLGPSGFRGTDTGTSSASGAYAYGSNGDFSLGAIYDGNSSPEYEIVFENDTGRTVDSLTLGWNYEQWRYANTSGFNVSGTAPLPGSAQAVIGIKDFVGVATGVSGTVSTTPVPAFTVSDLYLLNGQTFRLTFKSTDGVGADNGVAIDDLSYSYTTTTATPEPDGLAILLVGGLCTTASSHYA